MLDPLAARGAPGQTEVNLKTFGRYCRIDVLLDNSRITIESKVGKTGLGSRERQELARDYWLLKQGQVKGVTWEFSRSPITDLLGPATPLREMLGKLGFGIRINP